MNLTTESIDDPVIWQNALDQLPDPHPLQTFAWGMVKSRWGWSMHPTLFKDGETLVAAALILKRKLSRTPFSILYVPKGPVCDYRQVKIRQAVLAKLPQIAKIHRGILIKIDPDVPLAYGVEKSADLHGQALQQDISHLGWRYSPEQIQFRNTVTLDLTRSEEDLLAAMKQKTRYNIRLAGRKEVKIRPGTAADWPLIQDLYRQTAARDGFLIRPDAYYQDAWSTLFDAGKCQPFIAFYQDQPLGALLIVHNGRRAIYMYGASTSVERKRMPNYLLQWEAIRWAKSQGYELYDFWGAPDNFVPEDRLWGVWQFKKGFQGTVTHHLGAWDFPVNRPLYRLFSQWLPRYRALLRRRSEK